MKDYNGTDLIQTKKYIEMNCSNYVNRVLKSHGWDVASDQPDAVPTTVTNSREWDQGTKAHEEGSNIELAPAASLTTTGLSSVHVNSFRGKWIPRDSISGK